MSAKSFSVAAVVSILCVAITDSSSGQQPANHDKTNGGKKRNQATELNNISPDTNAGVARLTAASCDASLWNHVYNPSRLQVVNSCVAATGVIEESSADDDGDQHFLLKLDPGQDGLLKKKNLKKKGGGLVVEIVCANRVKLKKARAACAGYVNHIAIPAVGAHVRVTGSYVVDTHNKWTEIHPVSQIQVM